MGKTTEPMWQKHEEKELQELYAMALSKTSMAQLASASTETTLSSKSKVATGPQAEQKTSQPTIVNWVE